MKLNLDVDITRNTLTTISVSTALLIRRLKVRSWSADQRLFASTKARCVTSTKQRLLSSYILNTHAESLVYLGTVANNAELELESRGHRYPGSSKRYGN
jgi:hypothetical protein